MITVSKTNLKSLTLPGLVGALSITVRPNLNRLNATAGPLIATLPPCSGVQGCTMIVQKIDATANTVTVATTAPDTIDGAGSVVLGALNAMAILFATRTSAGVPIWTVQAVVASGISVVLDPPRALTVDGAGAIAPAAPLGYCGYAQVSGAGGAADDLIKITAGVAWSGKLLLVEMAAAGTITVKVTANIICKTDFAENSIYDQMVLRWVAVDTFVEWLRKDNV
jgi:hypothetical protein